MARTLWEFGDVVVWNSVKYGFIYKVENGLVSIASLVSTEEEPRIILHTCDETSDKLQNEFKLIKDFENVPAHLILPIRFALKVAMDLNKE